MRIIPLLFSLVLFLSQSLQAKSFVYTETEHFDAPSATELLILEQDFLKLGFTPLDQAGQGKIPLLNMDQVF